MLVHQYIKLESKAYCCTSFHFSQMTMSNVFQKENQIVTKQIWFKNNANVIIFIMSKTKFNALYFVHFVLMREQILS